MKKRVKKVRRKTRTRSKICGTKAQPRLSVFRSNKDIYGQLIDDKKGETLVSAGGRDLAEDEKRATLKTQKKTESTEKKTSEISGTSVSSVLPKTEKARLVGKLLAQKALKKDIKKVVFDRGSYRYHGRVRALAEGAREKGLKF